MYYSYKEIVTTGPQGTVKTFRPDYTYEFSGSEEENEQKREELDQLKSECQYLGEADDLHYYYVPDSYPLAEQNAEINAQQLETLDPTVRAKVILSPDSPVQSSDYIMSVGKLPYPASSANEQGNLAYLLTMIRGLAYKMSAILEQLPTTISTEVTSSINATNIITELTNQEIEKQASLVFLTDLEVGRRNKMKVLSNETAKFNSMQCSSMYFTSSLGFRCNGDRKTQDDISGLILDFDNAVQGDTGKVAFRDYDNQVQLLDKAQLEVLQKEQIRNGQLLYAQKWEYEQQIESADSIEALDHIKFDFKMADFSGGMTEPEDSGGSTSGTVSSGTETLNLKNSPSTIFDALTD